MPSPDPAPDGYVPLDVIAHLAHGLAASLPWGLALDGLLASQLWDDRKPTLDQHGSPDNLDPDDLDLPLARCPGDGGHDWHWSATFSTAEPIAPDPVEPRMILHRIDHRDLEHTATALPMHLHDDKGRYRTRWMPILTTLTPTLTWRVVGDPDAIANLLSGICSIGRRRHTGEGVVTRWDITRRPDLDPWAAAHLAPDNTIARPTPAACLQGRHVTHGGLGWAGIRPPYFSPARARELYLPTAHWV